MSDLLILILIPIVASFVAFIYPVVSVANFKRLAVAMSGLPLLLLLYNHSHWVGTELNIPWFHQLNVNFHLQVDHLSLVFLYLTAIIIPIALLAFPSENLVHPNVFYGLVLLLETLLIIFFTARDLVVFTVFWEAMLLPLYFIINLWGGPQRQQASLKFLVYMIAGSTLMIAAVLALYFAGTETFDMELLARTASQAKYAPWILAAFVLAFAVKTPLFPFHAWLSDAYCQASTSGTILLSAILSKAGIYGFARIGWELFPDLLKEWSPLLIGLAFAGVFYGGLSAWMQSDFKRLIAYSSFSHVNFILLGLFVWYQPAQSGAILQAFNHGITIAALFMASGWLEQRLGTTSISAASGLARYFPILCWLTLLFVLSSVALPGTNNFIGELMILFGLFKEYPVVTGFFGTIVILSVVYMLRWMQKMYFDEPHLTKTTETDIGWKEMLFALPLIFLILWIGIYPTPMLNVVEPAVNEIITPEKT